MSHKYISFQLKAQKHFTKSRNNYTSLQVEIITHLQVIFEFIPHYVCQPGNLLLKAESF